LCGIDKGPKGSRRLPAAGWAWPFEAFGFPKESMK
jgi:hypothetical protein